MVKKRIEKVLLSIGLAAVPSSSESLADCGFDSLLIVLSVSALEKEFSLRIPADRVDEESFSSIDSLEQLLISLGAK